VEFEYQSSSLYEIGCLRKLEGLIERKSGYITV
jgi:hypothetical protein